MVETSHVCEVDFSQWGKRREREMASSSQFIGPGDNDVSLCHVLNIVWGMSPHRFF